MSIFTKLVGLKINNAELSDDKRYLTIIVEDGQIFKYFTEGDCCSISWIESIEGLDDFIGSTVTSVENSCGSSFGNTAAPDYDIFTQVYFYKFKTSKGYFDIEMRNESNGYYGGSIVEIDNDGNTIYDY